MCRGGRVQISARLAGSVFDPCRMKATTSIRTPPRPKAYFRLVIACVCGCAFRGVAAWRVCCRPGLNLKTRSAPIHARLIVRSLGETTTGSKQPTRSIKVGQQCVCVCVYPSAQKKAASTVRIISWVSAWRVAHGRKQAHVNTCKKCK